jgi:hypothetical protein
MINYIMDYYEKYNKYKNKYIKCKLNLNKLLFIHNCQNIKNLLSILEKGIIYPGDYLSKDFRKPGGKGLLKYIYMNIHFKNIDTPIWNVALIMNEDIVNDHDIIFNKGWMSNPNKNSIYVNKNDNLNEKEIKMKKIKETILENNLYIMNHEILIDKPVDIYKYLLAVVCIDCSDEILNGIKELLKNHKNVKIIKKLKNNII